MKKIIAGVSAFSLALSLTTTSFALAATDSGNIQLEVEVLDTLSMDCYDAAGGPGDTTVALSDSTSGTGMVVAGTPSVGKSRCNVLTNDDQGYYLTLEKSTEDVTWSDVNGIGTGLSDAGTVLTHEDVNVDGLWYDIADLTAYSYASPGTAVWVDGTTKGLGFSVVAFPDTNTNNNLLDEAWTLSGTLCADGTAGSDVAKYSGIPYSPEAIAGVTQYEAATTTTDVCYKVDVPSTQESGQYGGQVTFTATSDASTYFTT